MSHIVKVSFRYRLRGRLPVRVRVPLRLQPFVRQGVGILAQSGLQRVFEHPVEVGRLPNIDAALEPLALQYKQEQDRLAMQRAIENAKL